MEFLLTMRNATTTLFFDMLVNVMDAEMEERGLGAWWENFKKTYVSGGTIWHVGGCPGTGTVASRELGLPLVSVCWSTPSASFSWLSYQRLCSNNLFCFWDPGW